MTKKASILLVLLVLTAAAVSARGYTLEKKENSNLSGIDLVVFDLGGADCALCIQTLNIAAGLSGDGRGGELQMSLSGSISSNRRDAVPDIILEKSGRTLTVRLFPEGRTFFGLSQSGTASFEAVLPENYSGDVEAYSSSGDIRISSLKAGNLSVQLSSGDLIIDDISSAAAQIRLSSGDLEGTRISASESMTIRSSSGDITMGTVNAGGLLEVHASSGTIAADRFSGDTVNISSSSGRIQLGDLDFGNGSIRASSGDIYLERASGGTLEINQSSGELEMGMMDTVETRIRTSSDVTIRSGRGALYCKGSSSDVRVTLSQLNGSVDVDVSSGDIVLTLPGSSSFNVLLDTSSGKIRSDFPVLGNLTGERDEVQGTVNGGGRQVKLDTSSGDITLRKN